MSIKKVTFICCSNNEAQLNDMLIASIERSKNVAGACTLSSGEEFIVNTIIIDGKAHKSAAEAYNTTIQERLDEIGEYIIFTHQDIAFDTFNFLHTIVEHLMRNPYQVIGVAGMPWGGKTLSNLLYLRTKERITDQELDTPTEVASLDECLFATTLLLYEQVKFDEAVCNHWHLYAVDFCLEAQRKCHARIVVIPDQIYHKYEAGGLSTDNYFLSSLWKMVLKYDKDYPMISAPCYHITTNHWKAWLRILRSRLKNFIHSIRKGNTYFVIF